MAVLLSWACLSLFGCTTVPSKPVTEPISRPAPESAPAPREQSVRPEAPSPRAVASLRLTERARGFIAMNQADEAIRTLERAINLNPGNGANYYYLAEAWLMKRNRAQAAEFNRLALIYLKASPKWRSRLAQQAERIEELRN